MKKVLIINGPNLNLLHKRNQLVYGNISLDKIKQQCQVLAEEIGIDLSFEQSNSESVIVDLIQNSLATVDGIIINAAGYTHTSVAIRDALEMYNGAKIELHISNIFKREEFRHHSFLSEVVDAVITGLGSSGYQVALLAMPKLIENKNNS
ncbi:MAG: type II 3-dehydroquinate dehydratase [Alphaproteobacteria bacterium]